MRPIHPLCDDTFVTMTPDNSSHNVRTRVEVHVFVSVCVCVFLCVYLGEPAFQIVQS